MAKYDIRDIAKARLEKMHAAKGKSHKMAPKGKGPKYDYEDEEEMSADVEEKTPMPEDMHGETPAPKHLMHKGHPGLGGEHRGGPKGIAVMIGIGKPMAPGMKKHPGLGESIEDEEPVMGGKYGK